MSAMEINKSNFEAKVMQSDKPVLIDFWAPWCGPCKMIGPIIDELAVELTDIKVAKVNVDVQENQEIASNFGAMSIPLLVVVKDGKAVAQSLGAVPKSSILEMIEPFRG